MQAVLPPAVQPASGPAALPEIPTQTRMVGGLPIHYADLPATSPNAGPPLLFIHGLGGWLRNWAPNMEPARALGYRCLALDLPGFGDSAKPDVRYDPRYFRQFVCTFLDMLGIDRATFIGNSMGGLISLSMAQRHPERVDRLVLVDAAGAHRLYATTVSVTTSLVTSIVRHRGRPSRIIPAMRHWVFEQTPPELLAELQLEFSKYPEESGRDRRRRARSYSRALFHILRTNLRRWLPTVTAPTLIVHGKQDKLVPFDAAGLMHREIPDARITAFDRCGHCPQLEMPDRFNARLADFLTTTRRSV